MNGFSDIRKGGPEWQSTKKEAPQAQLGALELIIISSDFAFF